MAFEYLCNLIYKTEYSAEEKTLVEAIYKGDIEFLKNKFKKTQRLSISDKKSPTIL